jgi:diguanylate cyclase (GGDEF)-like protein
MSATLQSPVWPGSKLGLRLFSFVKDLLPEGRPIAASVWAGRHTGIVRLVWLHAAGLLLATLLIDPEHIEGYAGGLIVALLGVLAHRPVFGRRFRGSITSLALLLSSSILVHLSGGVIEMHFHFFVALAIISFYQDWVVYLLAIAFVLVEHGVTGVMFPTSVYNHASAWSNPWIWAGIHAAFVAATSTANLLSWRVTEQQALHDPLTSLPNRDLFRDRVDHGLARARWRTQQIAVLFVDLDRFKPINDTWGHHVGDEVLVDVAGRLRTAVRAGDTVARLGGDEFAILLEDLDGLEEVDQVAQRLLDTMKEPMRVRGQPIPLRLSLGIALSESSDTNVDDLIRDADVAMYTAKQRGGGKYVFFEPSMRAGAARRLELEVELRLAVAKGALAVFYQPYIDLKTGGLIGAEALIRWPHETRGMISPGDFIPLAEETGLIVPLGRWILEQACHQARKWHERFPSRAPMMLSINVSPIQLAQPDFAKEVGRILRTTGVRPESITLEVTETALVEDTDLSSRALHDLKALGVKLAIDDFGTGYSSLNYLQRMPFDVLKIDRSFVNKIDRGGDEFALCRTIVELARTLSLKTVAEGIELSAQAEVLSRLGCDVGQGFLFARPVPETELTRMIVSSMPLARPKRRVAS